MAEATKKRILSDKNKSNNFNRVMSLQCDVGADTLRQLAVKGLRAKRISPKNYIAALYPDIYSSNSTLGPYLDTHQKDTLKNLNFDAMDISLLSKILLDGNILSGPEKKNVDNLRKMRNAVAHLPKAGLDDEDNTFKKTSRIILDIAKSVGEDFHQEITDCVEEIKKGELVCCRSNLELVMLNKECLMVKCEENSNKLSDKDRIHFGLMKWVKHLSRFVDMGDFLGRLKVKRILSFMEKRDIEQIYNYEDQAYRLVFHMLSETNDKLLTFCDCLRECWPDMADKIENTNTDGKETCDALTKLEEEKISNALDKYSIRKRNSYINCEDMHTFLEEELKLNLSFTVIEECIADKYNIRLKENDSRFHGIAWKSNKDNVKKMTEEMEHEESIEMTEEEFVEYVGHKFDQLQKGLGEKVKTVITQNYISKNVFIEMTQTELKDVFSECVEEYKFGIKKTLNNIQSELKKRNHKFDTTKDEVNLRAFDTPTRNTCYTIGQVRPEKGNLLVPVHEYVTVQSREHLNRDIVKEVIKFTAACINGLRNGTIHFGIKACSNGSGKIVGISSETPIDTYLLDSQIRQGIKDCFQKNARNAQLCIRPVQEIKVDNKKLVLEVDVVPFTGYVGKTVSHVLFPPKGKQRRELYFYGAEVTKIKSSDENKIQKLFSESIDDRRNLQRTAHCSRDTSENRCKELENNLRCGNDFVTDSFISVICSGNISGNQDERQIRQLLNQNRAYTSSMAVFDFDLSSSLRNDIEEEKSIFQVKAADHLNKRGEEFEVYSNYTWIYCNGYDELDLSKYEREDWNHKRWDGVKHALNQYRKAIPQERAMVIFLVFERLNVGDPMFETIRECITSTFKDECVVITENESNINDLKKQVSHCIGRLKVEKYFHAGLEWKHSLQTLNNVYRRNMNVVCEFPTSLGQSVEMTLKEKEELKLLDIDIISGEQCKTEVELMTPNELEEKRRCEQSDFYRGSTVTWWNLYFKDQVGEREILNKHKAQITEKLSSNDGPNIEVYEIKHHPGAGGSTLGMQLLWYFSQFSSQGSSKAYRCCVVNTLNDETALQIEKFRCFKDDDPKPCIILVDKPEENTDMLQAMLEKNSWSRTRSSRKLACICIVIKREGICRDIKRNSPYVLCHQLTKTERCWFQEKYKQLEKDSNIDVKTLLAFNVMRQSFNKTYIESTVNKMLIDVDESEMQILKCLSLINVYEWDDSVPQSIFDALMAGKYSPSGTFDVSSRIGQKAFGLYDRHLQKQNETKYDREIWNTPISEVMKLLITKRKSIDFSRSEVRILSQPLAKAVLTYIICNEKDSSLEAIVLYVLDVVRLHKDNDDPMSKKFVEVVNKIFKTRRPKNENESEQLKLKFSDLILDLEEKADGEDDKAAHSRVVRVIKNCFEITNDAMVGQVLARFFYICIKDFDKAEEAIKDSLKIKCGSSYLLDTYGQIYKAQIDHFVERQMTEGKLNDKCAAEIVDVAFKALEKFKEGQQYFKKEGIVNMSCFIMELKTAMTLLESFKHFQCFQNPQNFHRFLNNNSDSYTCSSFSNVVQLSHNRQLLQLRKGNSTYQQLEKTLRYLEEWSYQVRYRVYRVRVETDEVLLLSLREKFEVLYGNNSSYELCHGFTYISLLNLFNSEKKAILEERVKDAEKNLCDIRNVDTRDLLVFIGYNLVCMTENNTQCTYTTSADQYTHLLKYSNRLLEKEKKSPSPYSEAYLYFIMLHWPSQSRLDVLETCPSLPYAWTSILKEWESVYKNKFDIKRGEDWIYKPKTFFALGRGNMGNDIVSLMSVAKYVSKKNGKTVTQDRDQFWEDKFVIDRLQRLEGTLDDTGKKIVHTVGNEYGGYKFTIKTLKPWLELSNRVVTFVLGFTWMDLAALDVKVKERENKTESYSRGKLLPERNPDTDTHKAGLGACRVLQQTALPGIERRTESAHERQPEKVKSDNDVGDDHGIGLGAQGGLQETSFSVNEGDKKGDVDREGSSSLHGTKPKKTAAKSKRNDSRQKKKERKQKKISELGS